MLLFSNFDVANSRLSRLNPSKKMRTLFFSFALLAILSLSGARAANVIAVVSGNWSSPGTWGGALPGVEDTVKIPTGLTVTLNADVECGGITVEGRLEVERANRTLLCDFLLVQGAGAVFEVGTSASRFLQTFTLTLKGLSTEIGLASMGAKVLGAHNGGTLEIHGRDRVEWTHLAANAAASATSLTLAEAVDWAVGDSIMVTSSRRNWNEAETRTITAVSVDLRTVSFATGLTYPHNGSTTTRTRSTDNKSWTADLRAEVGLLSRNVKIQGDAVSETAGLGGHIMVMNGGTGCCVTSGRGFIEGVELYRMGQKSILARYPMHWHMVAEGGVGQYFRDSVVRHSFNRAITIHGTESTLVENNFCYDHLGHGIFLEDGSERFNVIRRNVVLATKRPVAGEEILETDNAFNTVQNRSPGSYWITNPNNTFTDNVAAGTEGTGFWFAFPQKPLNASLNHPRFAGLEPYKQPLGAFSRNTAHSCASGLDINDQVAADDTLVINGEWANNGPFSFNDCTWYSNDIAIYAGIGGERKNVIYHNNVFSDNETNLFLATYQLCDESLMLADSGFGLLPSGTTRTVYAVYDGAGRMKNNHLVGYNATNARFLQNIGAATKHPNHYFEGLTFDPAVPVRSILTDYNIIPPPNVDANGPGHPRIWAQVIVDVDGSISGVPNSSIVSNHPFLLTGGETRPSVWTNMYRSDHRFAQSRLSYGLASDLNPNISAVRTKAGTPTAGVYYINGYKEHHQLPFIVREDYLYTYHYESLPSTKKVIMTLGDAVVGDDFVACYKDFGKLPGIAVTGMTSRTSLAALKAGTTSGFYKETNGDFYVRPLATTTNQTYTITWTSNITMPVVDTDGDGVSDGDEAAAGTDPFRAVDGTDPFVGSEFNVDDNFEAWESFSGIGGETVTAGVLSAQSSNGDPQMYENNLRISGNAVPCLLVRMKASQNGSAEFFWGRLGATSYTGARSVSANYNGGNQWRVLVFPVQGDPEWQNQIITNLRFDPVGATGVDFQIDWIRASNGALISDVADQTIDQNTATTALPFTISDDLAGEPSFTVSGTSSNPALVPNANIVFGGSGASRTVSVTPAANQSGTATITLRLSDGTFTASDTFVLTVVDTSVALIPAGSTWKYLDTGANPGGTWMQNNFADSAWPSGPAMLGFGDLNGQVPATLVNATASRITTYFRGSFSVADPRGYGDLTLRLLRDDGAVVWLNGVEVHRSNMVAAPGAITASTLALTSVSGAGENTFYTTTLDARELRTGTNVIAVEVHQFGTASSDLGFDLSLAANPGVPTALISAGATWKYRDTGIAPPSDWASHSYADTAWSSGPARLGYGDTQATTVGYGGDPANRHLTTWFRHTFTVPDATLFDALRLDLQRDDGAVVYLNGAEILRDNLPSSGIAPTTLASTAIGGADETAWTTFTIPAAALVNGPNTLAIELHQSGPGSSDLGLDVRLFGLRQSALAFADWQAAQFGSDKTNATLAGILADLDKDGIVTLLEYALASDPRSPSRDALPALGTASGRLALQFDHNALATDLTLTVQAADSPAGPWTDLARSTTGNPFAPITGGTTILESTTGALRSVEVRDLYLLTDPAHPRRFMRLEVSNF